MHQFKNIRTKMDVETFTGIKIFSFSLQFMSMFFFFWIYWNKIIHKFKKKEKKSYFLFWICLNKFIHKYF